MRTLFFILFLFLSVQIYSQEKTIPMIEVTGSAEMSIVPDQIELEIIVTSYYKSSKHSFEETEKKFFEVLVKNKIPRTAITFVSAESPYYWYYWWWEWRHYYDAKTYKIKLDCTKYDFSFLKDFDPDYIRSLKITSSTHSKITEYRRQIKIEAIKAAKDKASVLLEAIGQKAGKVIEVIEMQEPVNNNNYWYNRYNNMQDMTSNVVMSQPSYDVGGSESKALIPSIKLRFEIKTKFEIL